MIINQKTKIPTASGGGQSGSKTVKVFEYPIILNMYYVMKKTFQVQPGLRWRMPVVMVFTALIPYVFLFTQKYIIQCVEGQSRLNELYFIIGITAVLYLSMTIINTAVKNDIGWRYIDARTSFMLMRNRKLMDMDYEYLETPEVLDLSQKATRSMDSNNSGVEGMMHSTQSAVITLVNILAGISILAVFSPLLVGFLLGLSAVCYFVLDFTKKKDKIYVWDFLSSFWRKEYYIRTIITNFDSAKDIRLYSMKEWLIGKLKEVHNTMLKRMVNCRNRWIKASMVMQTVGLVQRGVVYAWLIYCVLYRGLSIADFSLYVGTVIAMFGMLSNIFNVLTDLRNQSRQIDDLRAFLEYPDRLSTVKSIPLPRFETYEFHFEQVSFSYPGTDIYALKDLNLTLRQGERLAVVGLNGAGKSTFIKLLCHLYTPTKGKIYLNGIDIEAFDRVEYYRLVAPLFQKIEVFASSLSENVSMLPREKTDDNLVYDCMVKTGLKENLNYLPQGIHTELLKILYDDGIDLSGGEKQKLAFARALYKDAPIVVLDEPTSALDALAEYQMYQDFNELIGNKTAVYISHRLSSTRFCDNIAMFQDGRLIEYGRHEELLKKKGAYAAMFEVQAQYYTEAGETTTKGVYA